jgi:hypothetical protein
MPQPRVKIEQATTDAVSAHSKKMRNAEAEDPAVSAELRGRAMTVEPLVS